jgi:hypothetical protein
MSAAICAVEPEFAQARAENGGGKRTESSDAGESLGGQLPIVPERGQPSEPLRQDLADYLRMMDVREFVIP